MSMASTTLRMLLSLVRHMPVAALFSTGSLATHSAHIALYLLSLMLGERSESIMECTDVNWNPSRKLIDVVAFALALARQPAFRKVCGCAPDSMERCGVSEHA